jgi:hypothetical protein
MTDTTGDIAIPRPGAEQRPCPAADLVQRFADDVVRLHGQLSFRRLPDAIKGEPLYFSDDIGDGLITMTVCDSQIPARYLKGVLGFRLAQYLRLGLISNELVYQGALFHEPNASSERAVENIHTVTLDAETGRILGYIGLVCSLDPESMPLDSPRRSRFPAESAHHVDIISRFAEPGLGSHQVYEIKRFVCDLSMERGGQRARVPWHLILGLGSGVVNLGDKVRIVLGDSKESGALRHIRLLGMDPVVIDQTTPSLPKSELMWPSYTQKVLAKPFAAPVPDHAPHVLALLRASLRGDVGPTSERGLLAELSTTAARPRPDRVAAIVA